MNARTIAAELLQSWPRSRLLADELLEQSLARYPLSPADRGLVQELFYGCLRRRLALQFLREQLVSRPPRASIADLLDLGLYQIFFLEKIPAHAAVHETVELAKQRATMAEAKFVNAVLRQALRDHAKLLTALRATAETQPWVFYSHPRWLWERWAQRFGAAETAKLGEWNNTPPAVFVRLNTLKSAAPPPEIAVQPTTHPLCWRVDDPAGIFQTKAWSHGDFYVQDPSTLLAVDVLDPQPGESVVDVCAAPGGKTTYIAQKMQNRGQLIAADSSTQRLQRVIENCNRLGVTIVATMACEGTRLNRCLRGALFDRVLVDAPCSNTGVVRRRVDLRWRIEAAEIARLAALQQELLATAATLTKPGGVLVYSTCSLEPDENDRVAEQFSAAQPDFALETTRATFPPHDGVDGAFVARWKRR